MKHLTEVVPKKIENVYGEFESMLNTAIHYAEIGCNEYKEFKYKSTDTHQFIIENKLLDNELEEGIRDLINLLIEQIKDYSAIWLQSFILKQGVYYKDYFPNKRKSEIYRAYLEFNSVRYGDESVLKECVSLSESEKVYMKYIYERYKHFYEKLYKSVNDLFKNYKALKVKTNKQTLSLRQIALKYVYEGTQITRKNGKEIATQHGYTSGEKLFHHYTYYSSNANRTGQPTLCTPTKLLNKIKLFESVIAKLATDKQKRAVDELKILKRIYDTEYQ